MKFDLRHDWPILAIAGGGAVLLVARSASAPSSPGKGKSGPATLWPRTVGGQQGSPSRSSSTATSTDSGSLATQVIGDIIGQRTTLAEAKDQLTESEAQIAAEEYMNDRDNNTEAQLSLNSEQPPPNGWNQFFGMLLQAIPSFFGIPSFGGGGSMGAGSFGSSPMGGMLSGEPWDGYYPGQTYPSPTGGMFA